MMGDPNLDQIPRYTGIDCSYLHTLQYKCGHLISVAVRYSQSWLQICSGIYLSETHDRSLTFVPLLVAQRST